MGLIPEDEYEAQTPIASPIADASATGAAVKTGYGAGVLSGGAHVGGLGYGAGILSGRRVAPAQPPAAEQGDFSRGLSTSWKQTKQAVQGVKAFVGDVIGSDSLRDSGLQGYADIEQEIQKTAKPSDSFSQAWEDGDLIDFAQYGAGYVVGQAAEALASGGIGSFIGKTLIKGTLRQGLEKAMTRTIEKKVAAGMTQEAAVRSAFGSLGAGSALAGFNLTQELGQIYPEAVKQAEVDGEDTNLMRVFGSSVLAAALETVVDKFNLNKAGKVLKGQAGSSSMLRNIAQEAFMGGLREGGTEFLQTGIERWGASQELDSPEAIRDYIDSAALGVLGGGMFGSAAGVAKKRTPAEAPAPVDQAPVEPAAPPVIETDTGRVIPTAAAPRPVPIEVDETLREKYAPDLESRGIDPNSVEGAEAIQRMEAIERATGVIRNKEAEKERAEREAEVRAAFGETATSGVGVGVGEAGPMIQRDSVMPVEGERVLEPVSGAPESVTLPEPSWMEGETARTEAIAPEDVVARQQDWEAPEAFDFRDRKGGDSKVANRFVSEAQALGFAKKYATNTRETQFQVREAQKSKAEGGGKYYFIEERPLKDESHELVVGMGTREQIAPKPKAPAAAAAAPAATQKTAPVPAPTPEPVAAPGGAPAAPAPVVQNEVHDAQGQPYTQKDRDFVASVQDNFRQRFNRPSLVLDVAPVPEGPRGRALQAAAEISQRVFGHRVVFVKSNERLFGGLHRRGDEGSPLLIDVDKANAPLSVVGHELLHTLRSHSQKDYDELVKAARPYLSKAAVTRHNEKINQRYRLAGAKGLPADIAKEEMHADIVGDLFSDEKFWDEFAQKNPTGFQKVVTRVRDFLDNLINVLTGQFKPMGSDDYVKDVEKMRKVVAAAMAKYSQDRVGTEPAAEVTDLASIPGTKIKGEKTPTISKLLRNLTPEEQRKITDATAAKIIEQMGNLPSAKEMAAVAFAGRAKRGWYAQSADAISHVFGFDAPRFAALLAAMSPQTSVEDNLLNALNTWKNWVQAGRPTDREAILDVMGNSVQGSRGRDSILDAWVNNSVRALTTEDPGTLIISGPKVNSFFRNLVGVVEEVTNDAWMANYALVDQKIFSGSLNALGTDPGKGSGYLAMSARTREAAAQLTKLTGETWTPAEVQETVWSWAKTLYEMADAATEKRSAKQLVLDKALTDELINATPDFGSLFYNETYGRILEEAGYGAQLESLRDAVGRNAAKLDEESAPGGQAAPFAREDQERLELRAAGRLDQLREQRRSGEDLASLVDLNKPQPITRPGWDEATQRALNEPFQAPPAAPIKERLANMRQGFLRRFVAATVDPFVGLKELDEKLYMRARLTNGANGGLDALIHFGQVFNNGGALDVRKGTKGLVKALEPLGTEVEDFFRWVALNRAAQLKKQDRENYFTDESIRLRHKLVEGKMADGKERSKVYAQALGDMNALNKSVLELARSNGLIDQAGFDRFSKDIWYVPFYRVAEENQDDVSAFQAAAGLSGQKFGERLKGGKDRVDALLPNLLRNWGGLLAAAQKNGVARDALAQAAEMGAARELQSYESTEGAARVMVDGKQKAYALDDPMLANAILSMNMAAMNHPVLKTLNAFKRWLTGAVTFDPAFKVRNLLRDSIQAMAVSELPLNPIANVAAGMAGLRGDARASALAGGGLFGHNMDERDLEAKIKLLAEKGINEQTVLRHPKDVVRYVLEGYNKIGEGMENANRIALYNSMIERGKSHLEAAYAARDLMDFSLQGRSSAIRMLAMVLPFFNARLQGLYKLGRDGVVPTMLTIMGKGTDSDRAKAARFATVAGAVTLAGLLLYLEYKDDEDFKRRERWDRDNFWWFKVGDVAYRIPKPFELGAIGTLAERGLEQIVDDKAVGKDFALSLKDMLVNTFAFDPIPQAFRPLVNLVGNEDSFTGRPIETMGMQNLSKTNRFSESTSATAKVLSQANQAVADALGPLGEGKVLSPAQIDYLARGYFGWVGATVLQSTGALSRWTSDVEPPSAKLEDYPLIGAFAKELPTNQSRYVSEFYKSAETIQQIWADIKMAQRLGQYEKARELMGDNKEAVQLHSLYSRASRQISQFNQQMRRVEASTTLSGDEKRKALDTLAQRKAAVAERVELLRREARLR